MIPNFGQHPPFLEDEDIFQKSATLVALLPVLQFLVQPTWPIFELHR
jgi:hypothetical protein